MHYPGAAYLRVDGCPPSMLLLVSAFFLVAAAASNCRASGPSALTNTIIPFRGPAPHDETYEELLGMLFARSRTELKRFEFTWTQLSVACPDHRVCARFRELSRRGVTALLGSVEEELWFRPEC
ncbi:hypothetical protein MKEN_01376700 [Mycena kentingensis (nom. inval.)]|nr:hypothetical protein MKEN_01376700 [Mycena kentingensis (nom. inval.)]